MSKVTVEFFHDVICSFCFPMSYRMRKLAETMPEVEIIHRSYALIKSNQDFDEMFGSRAAAKKEIVGHWEQANQNDDLHRMNIAGMQKTEFPFPGSMKALIACKAAYFTAGSDGYWDVFDSLQNALFVQNKDIEDRDVMNECIRSSKIDISKWEKHYNNSETAEAVEKDLLLAEQYGIDLIPCLIINGTRRISGAQPLEEIVQAIRDAEKSQDAEKSGDSVEPKGGAVITPGAACRLDGDKMSCD